MTYSLQTRRPPPDGVHGVGWQAQPSLLRCNTLSHQHLVGVCARSDESSQYSRRLGIHRIVCDLAVAALFAVSRSLAPALRHVELRLHRDVAATVVNDVLVHNEVWLVLHLNVVDLESADVLDRLDGNRMSNHEDMLAVLHMVVL